MNLLRFLTSDENMNRDPLLISAAAVLLVVQGEAVSRKMHSGETIFIIVNKRELTI